MASVIYFKLKNAIQQQLVNFDGSVIQIGDVKRLIATKQGLGPDGALELTLSDPNTGDEYHDDGKVIPRNTLVVVKRTPATKFKPLVAGDMGTAPTHHTAPAVEADPFGAVAPADGGAAAGGGTNNEFGGDFYSEQPTAAVVNDDESKAMQSFLQGTANTWQREVRQGVMRGRGRGRGGRGAAGVAPEYKCPRYDQSCIINNSTNDTRVLCVY
jgi:E3 ubiquitin-protein ligase RBBP6